MSALAEALARSGVPVSGCDARPLSEPALLAHGLVECGVDAGPGHHPEHVRDAHALVVTAAVALDHPEVAAARDRGIPVLKRAEALGQWVSRGRLVGVAGTHGKTSTTAMTTHVLEAAGQDPTGFVGGRVAAWESNLRPGSPDLFVVEADEYDRSFLHLTPDVAVVTNMEPDHLDIYGDADGVEAAFRAYLDGVREGGTILACADDRGAARLMMGPESHVVSYGTSAGSMIRAVNVHPEGAGMRFTVYDHGDHAGDITISVPGTHNVRNALAAAGVGRALGATWDQIRAGLAAYRGVARRFQRIGDVGDAVVIDDYAHHPTEVRATLLAARGGFPGRRVVAVFQPHLYTRTRDFHEAFGVALAEADQVWVTDVYPAREAPIEGIDGALVARAVEAAGGSVTYHAALDSLAEAVASGARPGDVILTLGAGSIGAVAPAIVEHLEPNGAPA